MTFSQKVKLELLKNVKKRTCCKNGLLYGVLLLGKSFADHRIVLQFESKKVCAFAEELLCEVFPGVKNSLTIQKQSYYTIIVTEKEHCEEIRRHFYHKEKEIFLTVKKENFICNDCFASFLAGCFLSAGTVTDPKKEYHLEIKTDKMHLTEDALGLFHNIGIPFKQSKRKNKYLLYLKDSEAIEDMLTFIGATSASLEIMDTKVYKGIRNNVNRKTNCETANITKTVNAAGKQIDAIKLIVDTKGWEYFPDDLISIALLRFENPQMSLSEMGQLLPENLSKSAVNNRLRRILKMAQQVKEEEL